MSDDKLQQRGEVDRLLHRFAQVEPPQAMNNRVLARLRGTERERALASGHVGSWLAWTAVAVAVFVLVTGALQWKQASGPPAQRQCAARFPSAPVEAQLVPGTAEGSRITSLPNVASLPGHHPPTEQLPWPIAARDRRKASSARRQQERRAPALSFPAPPAPLTEEEQLLVHVSEVRTPLEAAAEEPLLHTEPAQVPGERLPGLPRDIPGKPLPTLAAVAPGNPLPNFTQAMKTGDQP